MAIYSISGLHLVTLENGTYQRHEAHPIIPPCRAHHSKPREQPQRDGYRGQRCEGRGDRQGPRHAAVGTGWPWWYASIVQEPGYCLTSRENVALSNIRGQELLDALRQRLVGTRVGLN